MSIGSYIEWVAGQRTSPTSSSGLKLRMKVAVCSFSSMSSTPGSVCRAGAHAAHAHAMATTPAQASQRARVIVRRSIGGSCAPGYPLAAAGHGIVSFKAMAL